MSAGSEDRAKARVVLERLRRKSGRESAAIVQFLPAESIEELVQIHAYLEELEQQANQILECAEDRRRQDLGTPDF